jgi:hypothetical protein
MTVVKTRERRKRKTKKLVAYHDAIGGLEELDDNVIVAFAKEADKANDIMDLRTLSETWFISREDCIYLLNSVQDTRAIFYLMNNLIGSNIIKFQEEDHKISIGLYFSRAVRIFSILDYILQMKVPSDEYKELSWEDKIRSFAVLPDNWDGEGAKIVAKTRILGAIEFLEKFPEEKDNLKMVFPSIIGSVGLVYYISDYRINVTFLSKDKVEISVLNQNGDLVSNDEMFVSDIESLKQFTF